VKTAELIQEVRAQVASAIESRERAGITYRGIQMSADELLQLCDAASNGLT